MIRCLAVLLVVSLFPSAASARVVVFWQRGFPTVASDPIDEATLRKAIGEAERPLGETGPVRFADITALNDPATLQGADLLVLPYGSAAPVDAWKAMEHYVNDGGNILILGGQPLHVPVHAAAGGFEQERPQDTYSRILGIRHTYEVPVPSDSHFAWKPGYETEPTIHLAAKHFYTAEGRLNGLGYMVDATGLLVAAPVIVMDHRGADPSVSSRIVALDFDPDRGFWAGADGRALLTRAIAYASQGSTELSIDTLFSALRPNEAPQLSLHLQRAGAARMPVAGEALVTLSSGDKTVASSTLSIPAGERAVTLPLPFDQPLPTGFYTVSAAYTQGHVLREFYRNGFWVTPPEDVEKGPALGVHGDFLTRKGETFFPVGTNYFTTEENGWDFSGPRNAAVWEHDFAEMASHGVSFVRTGVWMPNGRFIEGDGQVTERFLRNLEAFLLSAQRHGIAVNFTFFAFSPHSGTERRQSATEAPPNPYLDVAAVRAEQAYVSSVVRRFKSVPWLSWDLINEPSFSNPRQIFKGNLPNNDPAEVKAWHEWLRDRYKTTEALAEAWAVTPEQLGGLDSVPLPAVADLTYDRYGNPQEVRALDYNLFAQAMFHGWVKTMVGTIRGAGSRQLIDVGQDEGGVTNRVLNQFYADAGVSFTTNHTYWQDDALLWDSVAAKRPGTPNITGETGYQPVWNLDGSWRYDEFTGEGLTERKWALGFAAGSSGAMQWDWAREVDFGMQRSDGSARVWENMMRDLGEFAAKAAPHVHGLVLPEVALVLPQSLQLSVLNGYALEAQQNAVRALFQYAHAQAYAVGEYQMDTLGSPKLILLPSPMGLTPQAWEVLEAHVREGATLLVTGPFGGDAHLHPTGRESKVGLPYETEMLSLRDQAMHWPGGEATFHFDGKKTTALDQARLGSGKEWEEVTLGKGRILFATLPIELSDDLDSIGQVYAYALRKAGVAPVFTTENPHPGILICPTVYPDATLYVLTSEAAAQEVSFHDVRSQHDFAGTLQAGRAALLMISKDGSVLSQYHWNSSSK